MAKHNLSGADAESAAANYLAENGFEIIDTNWKTKWCEIDIVAKKGNVMYFVEVKYRSSVSQGGGFDYITNKKLQQMKRAADSWVLLNKWQGEYVLSAAEASGDDYKIEFIEQI